MASGASAPQHEPEQERGGQQTSTWWEMMRDMTRAARLIEHGEPLRVEDVKLPDPGPGEVRVRLAFAGVNPIDRYNAEGRAAADGPVPRTLGGEASGLVDGQPVVVVGAGLGSARDGVFATEAVVPVSAVVPAPGTIGLEAAGAMGVAGLTSWNVVSLAGVGPEDRVLVLGASGGVGSTIVSLVHSLGATVWGQCNSPEKAEAVRGQGADEVVVASAEGLADAVRDLSPTVVTDPLGGAFTGAALSVLALDGRLVLFGTSAGSEATLQLQPVYRSSQRILGYGGLRLSVEKRREDLTEALSALVEGRLRIRIGRTFPLERVNDAFAALGDRSVAGKILLELDPAG
jgi:NADPH:quinone reductase